MRSHTCAIAREKLLELRKTCANDAGGAFIAVAREWMPILIDELLLHDDNDDIAIPDGKETP